MRLKEKGFNGEIYELAKKMFSKKMAKHFTALFENVLENLLKTTIFPYLGNGLCILPYVTSTIQLAVYRYYSKMHAKISKVLTPQPASR